MSDLKDEKLNERLGFHHQSEYQRRDLGSSLNSLFQEEGTTGGNKNYSVMYCDSLVWQFMYRHICRFQDQFPLLLLGGGATSPRPGRRSSQLRGNWFSWPGTNLKTPRTTVEAARTAVTQSPVKRVLHYHGLKARKQLLLQNSHF